MENLAKKFAAEQHERVGQRRKYTNEPYINHPAAVVEIIRSVPHTNEMIAAAWLHDVVEDTQASFENIHELFGPNVLDMVSMLTNPSSLFSGCREFRKKVDFIHISSASPSAQTIKLADIIDNVRTIAVRDPEFAKRYLREKQALLAVLNDGDPTLHAWAGISIAKGLKIVG